MRLHGINDSQQIFSNGKFPGPSTHVQYEACTLPRPARRRSPISHIIGTGILHENFLGTPHFLLRDS